MPSNLTKLDTPPLQNGRQSRTGNNESSGISGLLRSIKGNSSLLGDTLKKDNTDTSQSDDFNRWLTNIVDTINTDLENIDTMLASMDARLTALEAEI